MSRDENVHIFPPSIIARLARIASLVIIVLAVSAPVVICTVVANTSARIVVTTFALGIFLTVLSSLTAVRVVDLFIAGAT